MSKDIEFIDELLEKEQTKPIIYEKFDINGNRTSGPPEKVFAQIVLYPSGTEHYEIMMSDPTSPYDPNSLVDDKLKKLPGGLTKFKMGRVSKTVFEYYMEYLRTKRVAFISACKRHCETL